MSSKIRRPPKVRSSKKFCEEKFSCHGEKVEAEYECEECKSLQCLDCEQRLHELAKFVFHDRKRLQPPPSYQLCQLSCEDRNYSGNLAIRLRLAVKFVIVDTDSCFYSGHQS